MTDKSLTIEIGSRLDSSFAKPFKQAQGAIREVAQELAGLKKQQQLIKRFELDVAGVEKARQAFRSARDEVMRLRLEAKKNPTAELSQALEKAERKADKLNQTLVKQRARLDSSSAALKAAGLSTTHTAAQYAQLDEAILKVVNRAKQLDQLKAQQDALGQSSTRLRNQLLAGTAVLGTLAAGLASTTGEVLTLNKELLNTEQKLGVSAQSLQVWGLGAETVGLSSEKMGDILKDVSDKLGDLAATGGGEAKDVFETLNLHIKDFQHLKPHEALQKIIDRMQSMKDLSQHQRVFLLESLADEASALYPLLKDSGAELAKVKALADSSGAIISPAERSTLKEANAQLAEITLVTRGLQTQAGLLGAEFLKAFGPDLSQGIQSLAGGLREVREDIPTLVSHITTLGTILVTAKAGALAFEQAQLKASDASLSWKTAKDQAAQATTAYTGRLRVLNRVLPATTLAARGLTGVMSLLGGPAGLVIMAATALYTYREEIADSVTVQGRMKSVVAANNELLKQAKQATEAYTLANQAGKEAIRDKTAAQLELAKATLNTMQVELQQAQQRIHTAHSELQTRSLGPRGEMMRHSTVHADGQKAELLTAKLQEQKRVIEGLSKSLRSMGQQNQANKTKTEQLAQATGQLTGKQKDSKKVTTLTTSAFKEESKALQKAVIAKTQGAEAAYRYELQQKGVTATEIEQLVALKRKAGGFDKAKASQEALAASGETYEQQQKRISEALQQVRESLTLITLEHSQGKEAAERHQLASEGFTAAQITEKLAADARIKSLQAEIQQREQVSQTMKQVRESLMQTTLEHAQGKAAAERHQLASEGFTTAQIAEKQAADARIKSLQEDIKQREQVREAMQQVRESLALVTLEHSQGKEAAERHQLASEGFTTAQIAEKQAADARIQSLQEDIKQREQVSEAMKRVRESLALVTLEHSQGKEAAERHKLASEGFTAAQMAEKQAADERIKSLQDEIKQREQVMDTLEQSRKALELQILEREQGKEAADLQRLALQGFNEAQAKEQLLLKESIKQNETLNQQRIKAAETLEAAREELALQTLEREQGKRAADLQRLALKGFNEEQAKEQLLMDDSIEKTRTLNQQRQRAKETVKALAQTLEFERRKLSEGAEAARHYQLKTQGYTDALAQSQIEHEKNISLLKKQGELAERVNDHLTNSIMEAVDSGKLSFKSLADSLKQTFNNMVLRPVIQAAVQPIAQNISHSLGGAGNQLSQSLGQGPLFGTSGNGGLLGNVLGSFGGGISSTVSGLFGGGSLASSVGALAGALGPVALIGGAVSLVKKLFSKKPQKVVGEFGQFADVVQDTRFVGDQRRDERVFYQTARSDREFHRTSAFGQFGVLSGPSQSIGRDSEEQIPAIHAALDAMTALDNAFVALLPSTSEGTAQIERTAQALDGFSMNALNTQDLLRKRMTAIYNSMASGVKEALNGVNGSFKALQADEMTDRLAVLAQVSQTVQPTLEALGLKLSEPWDKALRDATRLSDALGGVQNSTAGLQGVMQHLMSEQERSSQAFTQAREQITGLNQSLGRTGEQTITTRAGLLEYIRGLDLSKAKNAELAAQAIQAAGAMGTFASAIEGIQGMFAGTISQIENDLLSQQEKVSKYMGEAQSLFEQLQAENDPGRIAEISEQINQSVSQAWSNMTEDQKAANADYLKTMLQSSSDLASEQLKAGMGNADLMRSAIEAMDKPVAGMNSAAHQMEQVAGQLASAIPKEIAVQVNTTVTVDQGRAQGSYANGLSRVPQDGHRAILHKDELVATRREANWLRQGFPVIMDAQQQLRPLERSTLQEAANDTRPKALPAGVTPLQKRARAALKQAGQHSKGRAQTMVEGDTITISIQQTPGQSNEDLVRLVRKQLDQRDREKRRRYATRSYDQ